MNILFLAAEVAPFAKVGGLADVSGSLPKALKALGHDVRVVMPAYANIEAGYPGVSPMEGQLFVQTGSGTIQAGAYEGTLPNSTVPIYFIAEQNLFNRDKIYGFRDDAYRFAFFSMAALDLTKALGWKPDLVHAHDWHSAPALFWLATNGQSDPFFQGIPSIYTIHNLAHQGLSPWEITNYMKIETSSLSEEAYGQINFMARGIYHGTIINTVSPTYAREIMSKDGGARLDGLLHHRYFDLHGILNGLDYDLWNPTTDIKIAQPFSKTNVEPRIYNKRALQAHAGLPQLDHQPVLAIVSRLDWQKGIDLLEPMLHRLLSGQAGAAQFIVLGTGAKEYEDMFRRLAYQYPHRMAACLEYDANLANLIYAGSDMFLMPSRFEPCGLGQLIAMRYGSVPIVRATGGLADTVHDGVTGFSFSNLTADSLWQAVKRATYTYNTSKQHWQQIQANGMKADFSWSKSALSYQQMYQWALARHNRPVR